MIIYASATLSSTSFPPLQNVFYFSTSPSASRMNVYVMKKLNVREKIWKMRKLRGKSTEETVVGR